MVLDFDRLTIRNFKCFVGAHTTLDMTHPGLFFVRGRNETNARLQSNGAGKSSLFDALCWCLYGRTPSGLRNPDIVPWVGNVNTEVVCEMHDGKDSYSIKRAVKRLTINDEDVGQPQVDALLGLPLEVFTHTVLLGQSQPLFFDLDPRHKMDLFASILDLERWDKRSDTAKRQTRDLDVELGTLDAELRQLRAQEQSYRLVFDKLQIEHDEWQAQQSKAMEGAQAELEKLTKDLEFAETRYGKAVLDYDGAVTEIKGLRHTNKQLTESLDAVNEQINAAQLQMQALANEYERMRKLHKAGVCPTCGQKLTHTIKGTDLEELKRKIGAGRAKIMLAQKEDLLQQIRAGRGHLTQFQEKAEHARDIMDGLNGTLARDRARVKSLQERNVEREIETNPYRLQLNDLRRTRKQCESQIKECETQRDAKHRQHGQISHWVKGFKDIKLYVIEEVLSELQLITNSMLGEVGLADWSVQYAIERETKGGNVQRALSVVIHSPANKSPVKWESFSGGEGQRLRLVGALALSEVLLNHAGVTPSLEILDEPSAHLSGAGRRDLVEFLAYRSRTLQKTIFYVDHHSMDSGQFAQVLTVVKTNKGSTLEA